MNDWNMKGHEILVCGDCFEAIRDDEGGCAKWDSAIIADHDTDPVRPADCGWCDGKGTGTFEVVAFSY